jgi:SNF2 family DNA or RNA helicase
MLQQPPIRKTDLWAHQLHAYHFAFNRHATMLSMFMGTGKTRVAIDLAQNWLAATTLVICPKSILGVWEDQLSQWLKSPNYYQICVLNKGTSTKKRKTLEKNINWARLQRKRLITIVNYETAKQINLFSYLKSIPWDLVVLDESHKIKAHNSMVSKRCALLNAKKKLCLTGTPMPHSPLDVFGQYRFLDKTIFGDHWHRFRFRYAILKHIPGVIVAIPDGFQNQDELQEKFSKIACVVDKDVLDLPDAIHQKIPCEMPAATRKIYQELKQNLVAEVDKGFVTAANALVRLLRLQQITSGFVRLDEEDDVTQIDTTKADALKELIENMPPQESVVVFCRFLGDLASVKQIAEEMGRPYTEISGRQKDISGGRMLNIPQQVLAVQIQSGGLGIDLTAAKYAVYMSLGFSLGEHDQSVSRLWRPGQKQTTHFYHLITKNSIDEHIYAALNNRRNVVEAILEGLRYEQKREPQDQGA